MEYAITFLAIAGFAFFIYKKVTKKDKPSEYTGVGYGGGSKPDINTHEK